MSRLTLRNLFAFALVFSLSQMSFALGLADDPYDERENKMADGPIPAAPKYLSHFTTRSLSAKDRAAILNKYSFLDPHREVPQNLLEAAVEYFDTNLAHIPNKNFLSVIDFSKSSAKVRFFVINMNTGAVWSMHVAHGKGSDVNHDGFAEKFSNVEGSNMSSLGIYLSAETYTGRNGYSLRMDGLSSTNSNARERAIVIHGANYVSEENEIQGRSAGCPAVTHANRDKLINQIKEGSVIYAGLSGEK
jgi:hypothetical protein